jgi:uncharacterized protein (TIGR03437 family)
MYSVDGVTYTAATIFNWPQGSKHVISTDKGQDGGAIKTLYTFQNWQYTGGLLSNSNSITITADPMLKEFYATFSVQHGLSLNFSNCPADNCAIGGRVLVNDAPYTNDTTLWFQTGALVRLVAEPQPGFVFAGWDGVDNQKITGFLNIVTMNYPTVVRPQFLRARRISLTTEPAGLDVYADRGRVSTPAMIDWAYGSTHTLGVPSPQIAANGTWWLFSRWSDDAPENRTYTVEPAGEAKAFTAIFVPATATDLRTSPGGLTLVIDGRDNWPAPYLFPWGAGETHKIEAPEEQTDQQGRLWQFSAWSNGGARSQSYEVPAGPAGQTVRLTAIYTAVGRLTVTSAISGLTIKVDGSDCATPCDIKRPVGTVLRVSAPKSLPFGEGSRGDFDGWPGSGSYAPEWSVTLGTDPIESRLTYRTLHRLSATANPSDGASWRMQPASQDGYYDAGETVTVTAMAQPGFRFRRWSGDASGIASSTSVAMGGPRAVEAMMEKIPYIAPAGVSNAAGAPSGNGVAPGSIVSIFGASFAAETTIGPDNPLSQAIGCLTVRVGSRLLPLFFVSPTQINVQLPEDSPLGEQKLVVSCQGSPDVDATFQVVRNSPGLFAGAVLHADGSVVTADAPARRGELLTVYGTGFGPAASPRPFGFAPADPSSIVDEVTIGAGELTIKPERSFAAAGKVGLDAVQFRLPQEVGAGTVDVRVTVNGVSSNPLGVPVQ